MFGAKLRVWEDALQRWRKKCKGVQEEYQKIQRSRALVSQRMPFEENRRGSPLAPRARSNDPFSDASPAAKPSSMSIATEERLVSVEGQAKRCDEKIKWIEKMISRLNNARTTGMWIFNKHPKIRIRKQKNFLSGKLADVNGGENLEVLKVDGDWLWVRNSTGVEGWVYSLDGFYELPVELSAEPGSRPLTPEERERYDEDIRSIGGSRG